MSAFENLRKFFNPTDYTVAIPSDPFVVIDKERAALSMRLDTTAKENGSRNYPASDSKNLDSVEAEIVSQIGDQLTRAQSEAASQFQVYGMRLSELELLRELSGVSAAGVQALGDFRSTVINRQGRLALAKQAIVESYHELALFKAYHGLARPAHNGLLPIYAWSTIGFAWLIESLANTAFLRVNDEHGLIGGFIAAAVVAAVNVFLSALVGRYWWPYLFHKSLFRKTLAIAGSASWFALIVLWNLLAGHFRDAKAAGLDSPEQTAIQLLAEKMLQFDSIYSYGLLAAGIAFALLAATAAFKADDPYPGYGAIYKRHQARCDEYADEIQDILQELKETRDEAITDASAIRSELGKQFRERGQIIASRDSFRSRYMQHQQILEDAANYLLNRYRDANVMARSDQCTPAHFSQKWHLVRSELPNDNLEPVVEAEVLRAQETLEKTIRMIGSAHDEAIEGFQNLDKIKESLGNG